MKRFLVVLVGVLMMGLSTYSFGQEKIEFSKVLEFDSTFTKDMLYIKVIIYLTNLK